MMLANYILIRHSLDSLDVNTPVAIGIFIGGIAFIFFISWFAKK